MLTYVIDVVSVLAFYVSLYRKGQNSDTLMELAFSDWVTVKTSFLKYSLNLIKYGGMRRGKHQMLYSNLFFVLVLVED